MIFLPNLFFTEISWNFIPEIETDFPSNWEIHQFFGSRSWFPWIPNLWHQKICGSNAKNNKKRWGIWMSGGDVNMGCVANLGQKDFRWKTESMSKAFWRYPNVGHCSYIYIYIITVCIILCTSWLQMMWDYIVIAFLLEICKPQMPPQGCWKAGLCHSRGFGLTQDFSPLFWSKSSPFDGTIPAVYCYSCVLCTDSFRPQIHPNNLKKSGPRW